MNKYFEKKRKEEKIIKDEDIIKTVDEVIDSFTNYHIDKLINKKIIKNINGSISSGKESKIFWGKGWQDEEIAIKIYLTSAAEFKKSIREYILGDPRFESIPNKFRSLIYLWAKKEFNNLKKMREVGVNVPDPKGVSGNIVVMQFIGENGYRAPLLYEIYKELDDDAIDEIYNSIKNDIRKMVCDANLIHADLSEFNIMYWNNKPYIIDVSQSVDIRHPKSLELLKRDLKNIREFFSKSIITEDFEEFEMGVTKCL
ncbi:MAG: serine protein kinase RIO [Caldisphaera sp.]|nr:serine protein kinase RIO [Caldisphaera sp.]PMP61228.1 MAG: serine protein kinase RIO [Caldisphaera sp.]